MWWGSGTPPSKLNRILSQCFCSFPCESKSNGGKTFPQIFQTRIRRWSYFRMITCWDFTYIFTSHDFSWLQNGQVNWDSRSPVIFFFGGGFLLDFRRPIVHKPKQACVRDGRRRLKQGQHGKPRQNTTPENKKLQSWFIILLENKVSRLMLACLVWIPNTTLSASWYKKN